MQCTEQDFIALEMSHYNIDGMYYVLFVSWKLEFFKQTYIISVIFP